MDETKICQYIYGTYGSYVRMHSVLFVRDAIFPHGIAKRASKLLKARKKLSKTKNGPSAK